MQGDWICFLSICLGSLNSFVCCGPVGNSKLLCCCPPFGLIAWLHLMVYEHQPCILYCAIKIIGILTYLKNVLSWSPVLDTGPSSLYLDHFLLLAKKLEPHFANAHKSDGRSIYPMVYEWQSHALYCNVRYRLYRYVNIPSFSACEYL